MLVENAIRLALYLFKNSFQRDRVLDNTDASVFK